MKKWFKLDNVAKIFPPVSNKKDSKVFRFTCVLKEEIENDILQDSVNEALIYFPNFKSILKQGFFWHYLETTDFNPIVKEEKYLERLLMSLVSSLVYCSSIPYTEKTSKQNTLRFNISGKSVSQNKSKLQEYLIVAESQTFTRRLQDMPSSLITPAGFVKEVKNHFKGLEKLGVKISVLEKKDLIAKKNGINPLCWPRCYNS